MNDTTVVIIGGGATGSGILRDLSMRGIPALLLEMGGLCNGTSSRFHGLLHSGGRYAVSDSEAAAECIRENTILRRIGRQCVHDTEGFFVLTGEDDPGYVSKWVYGCAKAGIPAQEISVEEARRLEPALVGDMKRVFRVPDASIDGFRLVLHNVMSARRYGGEMLTYHEVTGITTEGGRVTGVCAINHKTGERKHISCQMVVNAAGSWSGRIASLAGLDVPVTPDKGTLIVFNHRFSSRIINRLHKSSDGDIFVPHGSITILGTTSVTVKDPSESRPTTDEVLRLLEIGKPLFPQIDAYRILRAFAGTRPLYTPGNAAGRAASRSFHISDHAEEGLDGMLTIFGGKFTTFRLMAEKLCDIVCKKLGVNAACRTAEEDIIPPASEAIRKKAATVFMPQGLDLIADRLGDEFADCVEFAKKNFKKNPLMCECEMVSWAEIQFVAQQPSCYSINDIRLRTRLGMGTCQGTFCTLRTAAALVENKIPFEQNALADMRNFVQERWKGVRCAYWGQLAREMDMTRSIYCATLGVDDAEGCERQALDFRPPLPRPAAASFPARSRNTTSADLIVVGSGLSGLVAALAASREGRDVALLTAGAGTLNLSTACIDVLGTTFSGRVTGDPLDSLDKLVPSHPYVRLGRKRVQEALRFLENIADDAGWPLTGIDRDGRCRNAFLPTIIGSEKTTCLVPQSLDDSCLNGAKKILVCGIEGIRDCTPGLAIQNLRRLERFKDCTFSGTWLSSPVSSSYRTLTALDVARALGGEKGLAAFCKTMAAAAKGYDAVLIPPVLGTLPNNVPLKRLCDAAGCPIVEMTALPPGVTGMRLGRLLMDALRHEGVTLYENTTVVGSERDGNRITAIRTLHEDGERRYSAGHFVIATGGLVSGGLVVEPGRATERILGLEFELPRETADWTNDDMFAPQPFALLGVPVTATLEPTLDGVEPYVRNVRYAGSCIGGFDSLFEKSGNGVALATGYHAVRLPWNE